MSTGEQWPWSQDDVRARLARHLVGSGIEIGAGHQPFPLPFAGTSRRFVDRWRPGDNQNLFPELPPETEFAVPDFVCNLDVDGLRPVDDESQDFVVASHVLEHLANPLGVLDEVHRVLKPSGTLLILLPDRHRTFDRNREPTPLQHLVDEYRAGVTEVSDEHLLDFLKLAQEGAFYTDFPEDSSDEAAFLAWHRKRSIHVHCWDESEFRPVLLHAIAEQGHRWEFVDGILTDDEGPGSIEFGYVLQKSPIDMPADERASRFADIVSSWAAWRSDMLTRLSGPTAPALRERVGRLETQVAELQAVVAHQDDRLRLIRSNPVYKVYQAAKRARNRGAPVS